MLDITAMADASLSKFIPDYPIPTPIPVVLIADICQLIIALCGGAKFEIGRKKKCPVGCHGCHGDLNVSSRCRKSHPRLYAVTTQVGLLHLPPLPKWQRRP